MKNSFLVILTFLLIILAWGCATIPKESVDLSTELTSMIRSAEKSHLQILDLFIAERKQRANEFMDSVWTPRFMARTVKNTHILDSLNEQKNDEQKAQLIKEFSEDAASTISGRREAMMNAIDKIDKMLRDRIQEHYDNMLVVNEALTAHLRSAAAVSETRSKMLEALQIDTKSLIPFDKIGGLLDKVSNYEGKVEDLKNYVGDASTILMGGK